MKEKDNKNGRFLVVHIEDAQLLQEYMQNIRILKESTETWK